MLIVKVIILTFFSFILCSCTSEKDATRALEAMGFTEIQMTGYSFFACSKDDFFHTGFIAKNAKGLPVKGTVCSGLLFKNSTVRF